jgi:hypothetical protein
MVHFQSGRLAFLKELLLEVVSLSYVVCAPLNESSSPNAAKMQKSSEKKINKIRMYLFGKV